MSSAPRLIPAYIEVTWSIALIQVDFPMGNSDSSSLPIRFLRSKSSRSLSEPIKTQREGSLVLKYKALKWHEQLQCWCLNFHGRHSRHSPYALGALTLQLLVNDVSFSGSWLLGSAITSVEKSD
ncbi:hypothetical protein K7X08_026374 [Anisodus acutangulus]|uniref:Tubby C-terminal domain-containing protein n=1 Tax=Anisodus acutangulus TaxID=402998 RepID=A0A9Q1LLJ2_9SOLA|nr:hypothetical protein K7X08_026374 [Anisodus acutangulus]